MYLNSTLKEMRNSYFYVSPKNQALHEAASLFLKKKKKILSKDIFHWLELITKILSFLQILSMRKETTEKQLF